MSDPTIALSAVDKSKAAFDAVDRHFGGLEKKAAAFGATLGKLTAALASIAAVGVAVNVRSAINASDELAKLSQRIGLSVESLSTLRFAAELADVNLDSLANGIKKLQVNMADAQRGTGEAVSAFRALNLNIEESPGKLKVTEELLLEIAEKFAGFEDGANKTALAIKIFGRAGADLIPFLNQGRAGIEELRQEA